MVASFSGSSAAIGTFPDRSPRFRRGRAMSFCPGLHSMGPPWECSSPGGGCGGGGGGGVTGGGGWWLGGGGQRRRRRWWRRIGRGREPCRGPHGTLPLLLLLLLLLLMRRSPPRNKVSWQFVGPNVPFPGRGGFPFSGWVHRVIAFFNIMRAVSMPASKNKSMATQCDPCPYFA